jgi:hypothetical protein
MESYANSNCANETALTEAMKLAEKMLKFAENGMFTCEDDSCLMVYGIIRDCGYKIRRTVEQEKICVLQRGDSHRMLH